MNNKNIIITGLQPWDIEIGSNCKNIALEFSKNNKVLYVNAPLDRSTINNKKEEPAVIKRIQILKGLISPYEKINENLTVYYPDVVLQSISRIPIPFLFKMMNKKNNTLFATSIKKAIQHLGMHSFIHFCDSDMFRSFHLKELLKPEYSIYYIRDNLVKNPYWRKHGSYMEPKLIAKSDLVVTNSIYYAEYAKPFNPNSFMVGQGCDVSLYDENEHKIYIADDVLDLKKPVIGYVGFLSSRRLDIQLIRDIALKKPQWTILLIGPEDDTFKSSDLHKIDNIIFTGSKPAEKLPEYVKAFDVCINPQILNDATIGNYPRKIDEYLAMGKPTVATKTKAMEYFSDVTYLANNATEYIDLIERALSENNEEKIKHRIKTAKSHSWENNVNEIYNHIHRLKK